MKFDYFSCFVHKVIVSNDNIEDHIACDILGEFFVIKAPSKKLDKGLIAKGLVDKCIEEKNIKRYDERKLREKRRKILEQERYEKQIHNGDVIVNLEAVKI